MSIDEIANEAIRKMNKKITDEIFLIIQEDRKLMKKYLKAVEKYSYDAVNKTIGKTIKHKYNLENIDDREVKPKSTLIQSHQKFE